MVLTLTLIENVVCINAVIVCNGCNYYLLQQRVAGIDFSLCLCVCLNVCEQNFVIPIALQPCKRQS